MLLGAKSRTLLTSVGRAVAAPRRDWSAQRRCRSSSIVVVGRLRLVRRVAVVYGGHG